jgi:uncharacterized membrane protein (DUF485 family)
MGLVVKEMEKGVPNSFMLFLTLIILVLHFKVVLILGYQSKDLADDFIDAGSYRLKDA